MIRVIHFETMGAVNLHQSHRLLELSWLTWGDSHCCIPHVTMVYYIPCTGKYHESVGRIGGVFLFPCWSTKRSSSLSSSSSVDEGGAGTGCGTVEPESETDSEAGSVSKSESHCRRSSPKTSSNGTSQPVIVAVLTNCVAMSTILLLGS